MRAVSRRAAMAAGVAVSALGASAAASPDAALVAACGEYLMLDRAWEELSAQHRGEFPPEVKPVSDRMLARQDDLWEQIIAARPRTVAGCAGKARVLLSTAPRGADGVHSEALDRWWAGLTDDLTAVAQAA